MSGYLVRLIDGPAKGFEYETLIEPDPEIAVAPIRRDGQWTRVLLEGAAWEGTRRYVRQPEYGEEEDGVAPAVALGLAVSGTTIVEYRLKAEATFTLTVTYARGHDQAHPALSAEQVEQGVGAFLSDLVHLQGKGITKLVVEIDSPEVTTAVEGENGD